MFLPPFLALCSHVMSEASVLRTDLASSAAWNIMMTSPCQDVTVGLLLTNSVSAILCPVPHFNLTQDAYRVRVTKWTMCKV